MPEEISFSIEGTVIVLRQVEYIQRKHDLQVIASRAWPNEFDPVRYRAFLVTQEGEERRLPGSVTQYALNTEWHIYGSLAVDHLGASSVVSTLEEAASIFKRDAEGFIDAIPVTNRVLEAD